METTICDFPKDTAKVITLKRSQNDLINVTNRFHAFPGTGNKASDYDVIGKSKIYWRSTGKSIGNKKEITSINFHTKSGLRKIISKNDTSDSHFLGFSI